MLLILAAVTISTLTGDNGILTQAVEAKEKTEIASIKEEADLIKTELQIKEATEEEILTKESLETALKGNFKNSTIENERIVVKDGKYDIVVTDKLEIIVVKHGEAVDDGIRAQIKYTVEDIDGSSKLVKLSIKKYESTNATATELEEIITYVTGIAFDDQTRAEIKENAEKEGMTYEECLEYVLVEQFGIEASVEEFEEIKELEKTIKDELGEEITTDVRMQLIASAVENGITYKEYLKLLMQQQGLEVPAGTEEKEETQRLEKLYEDVWGITLDDAGRETIQSYATSWGCTYDKALAVLITMSGVNPYYDGTVYEASFNDKSIGVTHNYTEFIATRNGIYTVNATTVEGEKLTTTIEITDIVEEKFSSIYEKTETYTDANGKTATIPAGFAVGQTSTINTIENGLVITDEVDSEGYSIGNEFVWIPVESEEDLTRTDFNYDGEPSGEIGGYYVEPYEEGDETEIQEYNTMKSQVLAYKGFYMGRYEAGDGTNGVNPRTSTTELHKVVTKKGVTPYNYISWGDSETEIGTNGAVYLSQNMYKNLDSVTSTLCYGCQWDAMCRFLGSDCATEVDSSAGGRSAAVVSGLIGDDKFKNMFDLCQNVTEVTMEVYSVSRDLDRVTRGGCFDNLDDWGPIYTRFGNPASSNGVRYGFRVTLYVSE